MNFRPAALLVPAIAIALVGCNSTEKAEADAAAAEQTAPATATPLTATETVEIDVRAKVKAVDYTTRVMTLQDADGQEATFVVDPAVRRLNEVRPGDDVHAKYRATLLAELRPPTADERSRPISLGAVSGRSDPGASPAAGVAQVTKVVTTVEAVDVPNMRVTLRGPMGDLAVVRGRNADNLKRLRVGDTIVITYTEALAIALEKIAPR